MQQLKNIENMNVPDISQHFQALRKIFVDLLHLQIKMPDSMRLYLLLESDQPPRSPNTISDIDLYGLSSTTISTESKDHRDSVSELDEILVDFKANCDVLDQDRNADPSPSAEGNGSNDSSMQESGRLTRTPIPATTRDPPVPRPSVLMEPQRAHRNQTSTSDDEGEVDPCYQPTQRQKRQVEQDDLETGKYWNIAPDDIIERMELPLVPIPISHGNVLFHEFHVTR